MAECLSACQETYRLHDQDETPAEGETLRLFFERTKQHWIHLVVTSSQTGTGSLQGTATCLDRSLSLFSAPMSLLGHSMRMHLSLGLCGRLP